MKKKICDLKPGTPFKYKGRVFVKSESSVIVCPISGKVLNLQHDIYLFPDEERTLVTVCKRIRKSDIVERK